MALSAVTRPTSPQTHGISETLRAPSEYRSEKDEKDFIAQAHWESRCPLRVLHRTFGFGSVISIEREQSNRFTLEILFDTPTPGTKHQPLKKILLAADSLSLQCELFADICGPSISQGISSATPVAQNLPKGLRIGDFAFVNVSGRTLMGQLVEVATDPLGDPQLVFQGHGRCSVFRIPLHGPRDLEVLGSESETAKKLKDKTTISVSELCGRINNTVFSAALAEQTVDFNGLIADHFKTRGSHVALVPHRTSRTATPDASLGAFGKRELRHGIERALLEHARALNNEAKPVVNPAPTITVAATEKPKPQTLTPSVVSERNENRRTESPQSRSAIVSPPQQKPAVTPKAPEETETLSSITGPTIERNTAPAPEEKDKVTVPVAPVSLPKQIEAPIVKAPAAALAPIPPVLRVEVTAPPSSIVTTPKQPAVVPPKDKAPSLDTTQKTSVAAPPPQKPILPTQPSAPAATSSQINPVRVVADDHLFDKVFKAAAAKGLIMARFQVVQVGQMLALRANEAGERFDKEAALERFIERFQKGEQVTSGLSFEAYVNRSDAFR